MRDIRFHGRFGFLGYISRARGWRISAGRKHVAFDFGMLGAAGDESWAASYHSRKSGIPAKRCNFYQCRRDIGPAFGTRLRKTASPNGGLSASWEVAVIFLYLFLEKGNRYRFTGSFDTA